MTAAERLVRRLTVLFEPQALAMALARVMLGKQCSSIDFAIGSNCGRGGLSHDRKEKRFTSF